MDRDSQNITHNLFLEQLKCIVIIMQNTKLNSQNVVTDPNHELALLSDAQNLLHVWQVVLYC